MTLAELRQLGLRTASVVSHWSLDAPAPKSVISMTLDMEEDILYIIPGTGIIVTVLLETKLFRVFETQASIKCQDFIIGACVGTLTYRQVAAWSSSPCTEIPGVFTSGLVMLQERASLFCLLFAI